DWTLSPIAPTPEEAILYPGVAPLLERAREHAHVAIMTGRAIEDGAAMINVDGLTYIGTHGLEWSDGLPTLHPVEILPEALAYVEPGKYLLDLVEQHLPALLRYPPRNAVKRRHRSPGRRRYDEFAAHNVQVVVQCTVTIQRKGAA